MFLFYTTDWSRCPARSLQSANLFPSNIERAAVKAKIKIRFQPRKFQWKRTKTKEANESKLLWKIGKMIRLDHFESIF